MRNLSEKPSPTPLVSLSPSLVLCRRHARLPLPPAASFQARCRSSQVGVRLAFYSSRMQRGRGLKRKSRMKEKRKKKKMRIRRLGPAELCNVKHHWCQLRNLGPVFTPIHKSRRLGRPADPMWIESRVAAGPPGMGRSWPRWMAASKAKPPDWAQREQRGVLGPGLGMGGG